MKDSRHESSVIAGRYEPLGRYEIQDHELVVLQWQLGSLSIWFDPAMEWMPLPSGKRGRRQHFSDADQAKNRPCAKPAAARRTGLDGAGLQHPLPPSKIAEREPAVSWRNRPAEPLDLLAGHCCAMPCRAVNSTGINAEGEGGMELPASMVALNAGFSVRYT